MAIGGNFSKPGMGGAAQAPLPSGGLQGGSTQLQQNAQQMVPNMGQFNGNPRGVHNTNFQGQGNSPSFLQQTNLGRYVPPTMSEGGRFGFNSNQWNNSGGYNYNLPGSYGSPQGQGQFAPMPGMFAQYMEPNMLSGNTFGFGNPFGQAGGMMPSGNDFFPSQSPYGSEGYADYLRSRPPVGRTLSEQEWGARQQASNGVVSNEPAQGQSGWGGVGVGGARGQDVGRYNPVDPRFGPIRNNILGGSGGNNGMLPGKDGNPMRDPNQAGSVGTDPLSFLHNQSMINNGRAPMPGMGSREGSRGRMAADDRQEMSAYDRPENRAYNMNALFQMMGGF